jgi:hypothetical protein
MEWLVLVALTVAGAFMLDSKNAKLDRLMGEAIGVGVLGLMALVPLVLGAAVLLSVLRFVVRAAL